jgi:hypothetical protein
VDWAGRLYGLAALLLVAGVVVQAFLGGLIVLAGRSSDAHDAFGFIVMHLLPLAMIILSGFARMGIWKIGAAVLLFLLVFVQPIWLDEEGADDLEAVHVAMAVVMAIVSYEVARRSWPFVRGTAGSDA